MSGLYRIVTIGDTIGCNPDGSGCLPIPPDVQPGPVVEPPETLVAKLSRPVDAPLVGRIVPRDALIGAALGFVIGAVVAKTLRG